MLCKQWVQAGGISLEYDMSIRKSVKTAKGGKEGVELQSVFQGQTYKISEHVLKLAKLVHGILSDKMTEDDERYFLLKIDRHTLF